MADLGRAALVVSLGLAVYALVLYWLLTLVPMPGTVQPSTASRGARPSASSE